jgi:hypothetical protein
MVKNKGSWERFLKGASFTSLKNIDATCRTKGLFIVSVGELESFYKPNSNYGPKW